MKYVYRNIIKQLLDFLVALIALLVFSPVFLLVIMLLLLTGHTRLFFVQKRVGLNDKIFRLVKFRSMTDAKDAAGKKVKTLTVSYNKSRQSAITKEVSEIVSGVESLKEVAV